MKDFTKSPGRLRNLPLTARVVYTVFLLFTLAGLALSATLTDSIMGIDLSGIDAYYAGIESAPPSADVSGGPEIALPAEAIAPVPQPLSTHKLLEVTHFHLFSMPVYLLILSHLYILSRASDRNKIAWIGVATLGTGLHIAAPWVARQASIASTALFATSGLALGISYSVMILLPLWEMWARPANR